MKSAQELKFLHVSGNSSQIWLIISLAAGNTYGESAFEHWWQKYLCLILRTLPLKGIQSDMERLMPCQRRGNIKYKGCVQFLENP